MSDWVVNLIDGAGYLGIAFLMFIETVFPPIPSELIMSIAGIRTGQGELDYWLVVVAGTFGAMAGNFLWYLFARALGIERFKPFIDRWGRWLTVTWKEVERAQRWFEQHGTFFVFLGRMLPTVRSLVSVPAGLLKMRMKSFLIASTIGTFGWTAMLAYAGYKLGENIDEIDAYLGPVSNTVIAVLVVGYVWRLWTHRNVGKKVRNDSE
ncbi:DedA family protein [Sphingomicrobium clamense]|uniref:DedA family protein n=1 Tax=Sphingomicrobium clamense TaxID=2851013 RepID=A0ABS6V5D6_9SPHN|nr:DedA family protein [Sphingomicrobium sp. B8]MBW0144763.1 DedA family protein [Sphingomicrobium sp. B8]